MSKMVKQIKLRHISSEKVERKKNELKGRVHTFGLENGKINVIDFGEMVRVEVEIRLENAGWSITHFYLKRNDFKELKKFFESIELT